MKCNSIGCSESKTNVVKEKRNLFNFDTLHKNVDLIVATHLKPMKYRGQKQI